jgi:hypothetical protein
MLMLLKMLPMMIDRIFTIAINIVSIHSCVHLFCQNDRRCGLPGSSGNG